MSTMNVALGGVHAQASREAIDAIIAEEAEKAGIGVADILGRRRQKTIVRARHAAMRRIRHALPNESYQAIGRVFSRHHASVMYAVGALQKKPPL